MHLVSKNFDKPFRTGTKILLGFIFGSICGYFRGKYCYEKDMPYHTDKNLILYQNEDQINTMIDKLNKPAVIYYYLSMLGCHYMFRHWMYKYSNMYPQNAIWVMVNSRKHFQSIKPALNIKYPQQVKLQVRFPKSKILAIDGKKQMQYEGNRRQVYNYDYHEEDFKKFLQFNHIIDAEDPINNFLKTTETVLFQY